MELLFYAPCFTYEPMATCSFSSVVVLSEEPEVDTVG